MFPFLPHITFIRLRVTFEALASIELTEYPGSAMRSCLMESMLGAVCTQRQKTRCADDCPERYTCAWSVLFNSYSLPDHHLHRKHRKTPPPYIVEPLDGKRTTYCAGDTFGLDLTLIGRAIGYLPLALDAFHRMGETGIGRGRGTFRLTGVESLTPDLDYEPLAYVPRPQILSLAKLTLPTAGEHLHIEFQSALRTEAEADRLQSAPTFQLFVKRLANRMNLLAHFHCDAEWIDTDPIAQQADALLLHEQTDSEHLIRKTSTMQTNMKIDGQIGHSTYCGTDLHRWMSLITLGSLLHVGSTTSMGLGKYRVIEEFSN